MDPLHRHLRRASLRLEGRRLRRPECVRGDEAARLRALLRRRLLLHPPHHHPPRLLARLPRGEAPVAVPQHRRQDVQVRHEAGGSDAEGAHGAHAQEGVDRLDGAAEHAGARHFRWRARAAEQQHAAAAAEPADDGRQDRQVQAREEGGQDARHRRRGLHHLLAALLLRPPAR